MQAITTATSRNSLARRWLRRERQAELLSSLLKGIAWLSVPLALGLLNFLVLLR